MLRHQDCHLNRSMVNHLRRHHPGYCRSSHPLTSRQFDRVHQCYPVHGCRRYCPGSHWVERCCQVHRLHFPGGLLRFLLNRRCLRPRIIDHSPSYLRQQPKPTMRLPSLVREQSRRQVSRAIDAVKADIQQEFQVI